MGLPPRGATGSSCPVRWGVYPKRWPHLAPAARRRYRSWRLNTGAGTTSRIQRPRAGRWYPRRWPPERNKVSDGGVAHLAAGRECAERACGLLAGPTREALESCAGLLETAVRELSLARVVAGDAGARAEARRLRAAVQRGSVLLRSAAGYHEGWSHWLGARTGGYRPGGEPAGLERPATVSVKG